LNNLLGGCYPAQLWLWAGAPKAGKSAAILCLADYIAQTFGQVVYFAIEMDEPEVTQRQLAMYSGVQVIRQNSGDLSNFEKAKLKKASDDISKYPLQIVRHSVRSIVDMRRFLRRQLSGGPIKSVIVDHVGKMTDVLSGSAKENKVERLDKTYNLLIDIAREFECTVHAIQHINRAGQQQGNRPTLIDIRDGGNPEGHANAVIFVHRPDPMNLEGNGHEGEFIVAASRNGKAGIINVKFDAWRGVWSEPEERSELTCGSR
jgi:replicative DNA helicase